jgi:hypothetical protein
MKLSGLATYAVAIAMAAAVLAACGSGGSSPFVGGNGGIAYTGTQSLAGPCPEATPSQSAPRVSEIINEFVTVPSGSPTDFEIVLCGNWIDQLGQQPLYGPYDPFCPPSRGPSNPCYPTITYNASTNTTTISFAGSTLYQNIPSHPGEYHFGLLSTWYQFSLDKMISTQYWTYASQPAATQPMVSVNWNPTVTNCPKWKYATVYVAVATQSGGSPVTGQWVEAGYCPKGKNQPKFSFENFGPQTLYVTSSGFGPGQAVPTDHTCYTTDAACAQDMKILSVLNYAGMPPPGYGSSPFVKLQYPPPSVLKPKKFPA